MRTFTELRFGGGSVAISLTAEPRLSGNDDDETLKWWDLARGRLRTLTGHSEEETKVAIAPDGQTVISITYDNIITLFNFNLGVAHQAFEPRVAAAGQAAASRGDPAALATLGEWYAFHPEWITGRVRVHGRGPREQTPAVAAPHVGPVLLEP